MATQDHRMLQAAAFAVEQARDGASTVELRLGLVRLGLDDGAAEALLSLIDRKEARKVFRASLLDVVAFSVTSCVILALCLVL